MQNTEIGNSGPRWGSRHIVVKVAIVVATGSALASLPFLPAYIAWLADLGTAAGTVASASSYFGKGPSPFVLPHHLPKLDVDVFPPSSNGSGAASGSGGAATGAGSSGPNPGGSNGATAQQDADCQYQAKLADMTDAKAAQAARAVQQALYPAQFSRLVVKPKVALDSPSSPLAALLKVAASQSRLDLANVPIVRIEELFGKFVTISLEAPVLRQAADQYVKQLIGTGYFDSVELDFPLVSSAVDFTKSYSASATRENLWHLAGPGFKISPFDIEDKYDDIKNGGANVMAAWEMLNPHPRPINVAVLEVEGVATPKVPGMPLAIGYNFINNSDLVFYTKSNGKQGVYSNNQPNDVWATMDEATRSIQGTRRLWYTCGICKVAVEFNGVGPNGLDWDIPPATRTTDEFYGGNWLHEHGSHGAQVAGLIANYSEKTSPVPGVVHNVRGNDAIAERSQPYNEVYIIAARVGNSAAATALAIRWSAGVDTPGILLNRTPAKIINMSFGSDDPCPSYEQDAIDLAYGKGVVLIAATGNDGFRTDKQINEPATCNHVISVTGHTPGPDPQLAIPANANINTTISAPFGGHACKNGRIVDLGIGVYSPVQGTIRSDYGFESVYGTSYSAPIVSGIVAMMLQAKPDLKPDEVSSILTSTGRKLIYNPLLDYDRDQSKRNQNYTASQAVKMVDGYAAVKFAKYLWLYGNSNSNSNSNGNGNGNIYLNTNNSCDVLFSNENKNGGSRRVLISQVPTVSATLQDCEIPEDITGTQIAQVFTQLSNSQIGMLTDVQLTQITAAQVAQRFSALPSARLVNMQPAQWSALSASQMQSLMGQLTPARVAQVFALLSSSQLGMLTDAQLAQITAAQVLQQFSPLPWARLVNLQPSQWSALSASQMQLLMAQLTPTRVTQVFTRLSRSQLGMLTDAQLTQITAAQVLQQFSPLPWARLVNLQPSQWSALSASQLQSLMAQLAPARVAQVFVRLSSSQVARLRSNQLTMLTAAQVVWGYSPLPWASLGSLNASQLSGLSATQRAQIKAHL
jgi:hypothetical protein